MHVACARAYTLGAGAASGGLAEDREIWPRRAAIGSVSTMAVASAQAGAPEIARPPIRLRTLLALGLVTALGWSAYPRAVAAWKLHSAATNLANYAVCMVGPTGPSLLRDNPAAFQAMVRRRLISAGAADQPFADCSRAAGELTGSVEIERAHQQSAASFVEYGAAEGERGPSLAGLRVTSRPVAELSAQAWPFARGGWTRLVRPSLGAREAVHPVELPRAGTGRGLPAWRSHYRAVSVRGKELLLAVGHGANLSVYRSTDAGVSWSATSPRAASHFSERCHAGERSFTFSTSDDGRLTLLTSLGPDGPPSSTPLARADTELFAAACDDRALVAAIKPENGRVATLIVCRYREQCAPMPLPRFGTGSTPQYPLDIARIDGATIVVVPMQGIVRVASTRDDGRSWTPFSVAFDAAAQARLGTQSQVPGRLLALGKRALLYAGGSEPFDTYPVLVSDDLGASWRAP
jgi:hypothetical protein